MNMNSRQEFPIKQADLFLFGLLGFFELIAASIYLIVKAKYFPGVFLFGLAERGFVELGLFFLLALLFLLLTIFSIIYWHKVDLFTRKSTRNHKYLLCVLFSLGLVVGWAAITIPPEFFGRFANYYQWLRPMGVAFGLVAMQGWALYLVRSEKTAALKNVFQTVKSRVFVLVFALALLLFALTYLTKFGVVADTPLWNVPGVPISGAQMFFVVLLFAGLMILESSSSRFRELLSSKAVQALIIAFVFLIALLVWGLTPLQGDSLAVESSIANPQPYPQRDAKVHDLGALSILYGEGINFKGYTDKPLYMVILAVFHLIAGYDYRLLQWVQIAFLSLIPVLAYLLGKKFHSPLFGILIAALVILQQRNAVILSRMISSVNVKILVTETFVLMGIIFLTLLLFNWNKKNDKRTMLLAGGVVGALSLIRLNPLLFIPFIGLAIILYYRKSGRLVFSRLLLFIAGFAIVFTPWIFSGTNAEGQPFFYVKIKDVIENRIAPQVDNGQVDTETWLVVGAENTAPAALTGQGASFSAYGSEDLQVDLAGFINTGDLREKVETIKSAEGVTQYLNLMANHFLHNIVTSVIPLPDILSRKGIKTLAERDYWDDFKIWDGNLSSGLIRFVVINLLLISLGIAHSWQRLRWRGLIPLGIFLVYDLAISISLTSGGRYIVPIIWVVFFYYALGFVFLIESAIHVFKPEAASEKQAASSEIPAGRQAKVLPVIIGLLVFATMVPAANQLLPLLITKSPVQKAEELFVALGPTRQPEMKYFSGILLYPTYDSGQGSVTFDFYRGYRMDELSLDLFPDEGSRVVMNTRLQSGDPVMLAYNGEDRLAELYIFRENELLEYWTLGESSGGIN